MQTLYKMATYPQPIRVLIVNSGQQGISLANRWMLGWPQMTKALLEDPEEYQVAFQSQLEQEIQALTTAQNCSHLTPTEILAAADLRMAPPTL